MSDVQDDDFTKEMAAAFETDENVVENPVVVTGSFYGKGMVLVTGTAENGTPVREVLTITSMHNPVD